jgi:hypothetical protein
MAEYWEMSGDGFYGRRWTAEALAYVEQGRAKGKVVITLD